MVAYFKKVLRGWLFKDKHEGIRTPEELRRVLDEMGMEEVPVFVVPHLSKETLRAVIEDFISEDRQQMH